jgi:formylglycine-generating enzyme required for sulfatase activity
MARTINLRKKEPGKRKLIGRKEVIVIIFAIVLSTIGIKASDNFFRPETEELADGACPKGMAKVVYSGGDFCIDIYEAAVGKNCPIDNPGSQIDTRSNLDDSNCRPVSEPEHLPWRYVSQDQAILACAKAGKRLPTNDEWFAAALGTPDRSDDWGETDCQVDNNWPEQPGSSGSGERCVSAFGAYDMIGNVWEWVSGSVIDGNYEGQKLPTAGYIQSTDGISMPAETNPTVPNANYYDDYLWLKENGVRGIARGGYWSNQSDAGQYSLYIVSPPSYAGVGVGFRCVR